MRVDVIIIGAGAAGLMAAIRAGQRGRKVVLIDHADEVGKKILISGGGRCNFTNRDIAPDRYLSNNPHFCKSALKSYTQHDFIALVDKHKIAHHEKTLGQLFCDGSAREIVAMLVTECAAVGVDIRLGQTVSAITKPDIFHVQTNTGTIESTAVILATGGLSIPKMGASGFAYQVAERFGLPVTATRPALVPLTFEDKTLDLMRPLSGVSLEVVARHGKQSFREAMVFTHRGLSGPAILQISSYITSNQAITLDLLPDDDAAAFLLDRKQTRPKAELKTILGEVLPQRLAHSLTATYLANAPHSVTTMGALSGKQITEAATLLKAWSVTPTGTEGYAKAEVTLGGVNTDALSSKTMESRAVSGLYVVGEAVDVTGWLGGYNFQWAWSSGWAAGSAV